MNTRSLTCASVAVLSLTMLAFAPGALGGVLASESFESYTTGSLTNQAGGGTGWTGTWSAPGNVTFANVVDTMGNSMSFTPVGGSTIGGATRALEVGLSGAAANQIAGARQLANPLSQSFYVGYLVRYQAGAGWAGANNTFTLHLGTNASSTTTLNFGLRGGATPASDFMVRYGTGAPVAGAGTGGSLTPLADYYVMARVNYAAGAFSSINMWVNPTADGETRTPNGDASLTGFSFTDPITHVFFRQAALQSDDVVRADELRIGTAWNDLVVAIPEPTAATLILLGVAAGLISSRRRSAPTQK